MSNDDLVAESYRRWLAMPMGGRPAQDEQVGEDVDHFRGPELAPHPDGQALMGELVQDIEHPKPAAVMGTVLNEVIAPDMVLAAPVSTGCRNHLRTTAVLVSTAAAAPSAPRAARCAPPAWHSPAPRAAEQRRDLAVPATPVLASQLGDVGRQLLLIVSAPRHLALCRAVLPEHRTGAALRHLHRLHHMLDTGTPARGAQKLPRAASARICLSRVRSATALRRRAFSASSSFSRFTWSDFRPPNFRRHP